MSSRRHRSEDAMAKLAVNATTVLVGGLGLGFTLRAVLDQSRAKTVVVAELEPAIIEWNRTLLTHLHGDALNDPRVTVHEGDVLAVPGRFDAVLIDVDLGPSKLNDPRNATFYGPQGIARMQALLAPKGNARHLVGGPRPQVPRNASARRPERAGVTVRHAHPVRRPPGVVVTSFGPHMSRALPNHHRRELEPPRAGSTTAWRRSSSCCRFSPAIAPATCWPPSSRRRASSARGRRRVRREADGITVEVSLDDGEVKVTAKGEKALELKTNRQGIAVEESRTLREAELRKNAQTALEPRPRSKRQAAARGDREARRPAERFEGRARRVVSRVTVAALKERAAQLGTVEEVNGERRDRRAHHQGARLSP